MELLIYFGIHFQWQNYDITFCKIVAAQLAASQEGLSSMSE
jgi:hypothetical protein